MATTDEMKARLDDFRAGFERLRAEVAKVIVGQDEIVSGTLTALIAGGHVLLEGVPGLGKTLLVRTLADALTPQIPAHPVHARPHAGGRHRHERRARDPRRRPQVRVPAGADLRESRARGRDQPGDPQDAVGPPRGDAGEVGHGRGQDVQARHAPSSCSPRRTRSRWKGRIPSPRRSSTASSSSCWSNSPPARRSSSILDRTTESSTAFGRARSSTARRSSRWACSPARSRSPTSCGSTASNLVLATHPEHDRGDRDGQALRPIRVEPARCPVSHPGREDPRHPRQPLPRRQARTSSAVAAGRAAAPAHPQLRRPGRERPWRTTSSSTPSSRSRSPRRRRRTDRPTDRVPPPHRMPRPHRPAPEP